MNFRYLPWAVCQVGKYELLLRTSGIHFFTQISTGGISVMENTEPKFGFNNFSETWNGRLAMLGFVIGLATELLTGHGILSQIGLL
jgi:hypothetical protein